MKEELDILKMNHAEELEILNKEITKKSDIEGQLRKQLVDIRSLEPSVQVLDKKPLQDSKAQETKVQTKGVEATTGNKQSEKNSPVTGKPTTEPGKKEDSPNKQDATKKAAEEQKKSQGGGGFFSGMASFFLTENEKKKFVNDLS
mmetsp:Transcript_5325/g.5743  ORF Transcript_5325/g.5743 Transcript_5325/m.5743 type:complete len:145 (+) Transcript_5325:2-436(+)